MIVVIEFYSSQLAHPPLILLRYPSAASFLCVDFSCFFFYNHINV